MRTLSFIIVFTIGCGQVAPYSQFETHHFRNDGNVQIDTEEIVVSAGDQAVLVGSWNFVQIADENLDLNGFEFYATERSGDRWGHLDPNRYNEHPSKNVYMKTFDLCWIMLDGEREGAGFTFDTHGNGTVNSFFHADEGKVMNIDLVCDIGSEVPATTLSVELRKVEGFSRDPETRFRRAEYSTSLDPDAVRAVITIE